MSELLSELPGFGRGQHQLHPVPLVAAVIQRDVKNNPGYLLIWRIYPPYAGKWAVTGDRWDFGETLSQSVTRDVREETGLTTDFVALRAFVNERIFPQQPDGMGTSSPSLCEVRASHAEPHEQDEGEVAWFHEMPLHDVWSKRDMAPTA